MCARFTSNQPPTTLTARSNTQGMRALSSNLVMSKAGGITRNTADVDDAGCFVHANYCYTSASRCSRTTFDQSTRRVVVMRMASTPNSNSAPMSSE